MQQLVDRAVLRVRRERVNLETLASNCLFNRVADEICDRLEDYGHGDGCGMVVVSGQPEFWDRRFGPSEHVTDGETLALTPESHDRVLHCMALHWSNDPVGQLIQCRLALKPGGMFLGALFGGETLFELREAFLAAEIGIHGGVSPRVLPMADVRALGDLLPRAGLVRGVADRIAVRKYYPTVLGLMHELRDLGETNAMADRVQTPGRRDMFKRLQSVYHERFANTEGQIPATFEIIFLTGWRNV
ncbi:MAG: SAM-dependent methyltransferase [Rhodobacteraceae bacterium]|nr:SAM-dependent methyltransferase [Paracoccaceae bacterium]